MTLKIVNRKYLSRGKLIKFQKMKGIKLVGYKLTLGRYEFRLYFESF